MGSRQFESTVFWPSILLCSTGAGQGKGNSLTLAKRYHKSGMTLQLHGRYDRKHVAAELGSEWNRSIWEQGVVRATPWLCLFVTLDKTGIDSEHHYQDKFLSDTSVRWQSQNRESRRSTAGRSYADPSSNGWTPLLFVRETKMRDGKARPFAFMGRVRHRASRGDNPITIVWDLDDPVPPSLWTAFGVPAESSLTTEDAEAAEEQEDEEDSRLMRALESAILAHDNSAPDLWAAARQRPKQRMFRKLVMANFSACCCVCGLQERALLDAAHLRGYAGTIALRNDPANGLVLCVLHHRALDRRLMRIGTDGTIHVAEWLQGVSDPALQNAVLQHAGKRIREPRFPIAFEPSDDQPDLPLDDSKS
jgi:hypothetical protein